MRIETPRSICDFGVARCDITPPVGIYHRMWGAASHDRSEGVHRPLTATALVFRPTDSKRSDESIQVIVALEHCLFAVSEVDVIIDKTSQTSKIARGAITLTFSHTHAAGLLTMDRVDLPGGDLIPAYLDDLSNKVAELVKAALECMQPVTIEYTTGKCNLAAHRDLFDNEHQEWVCGYHPGGPTDDSLLIARISNENGQTVATCVNYACHPTTLAWDNRLISPDYPGAMRELMEDATGAPCVFLQGASGDLGPVDGYVGDVAVADKNGRQLGFAALSALESMPPAKTSFVYAGPVISGATIGTWQHVPISHEQLLSSQTWFVNRTNVELEYRDDLPNLEALRSELEKLTSHEDEARARDDQRAAEKYRALAERKKRMIGRLSSLPGGDSFPLQCLTMRMGDAIWVTVQGEPYNVLQRRLREQFPDHPIIVMTIANGWGPSYLPTRETYGKGIYQESIAALGPGSLEKLIEQLTHRIKKLLAKT